ncbi:MAG: hypothetical protein J6B34_04810 [Clostridia bacterium]|nr:hypothetical protein [Clostridia bacterium]
MCSICNLTPCTFGCPNYDYEKDIIYKCRMCQGGIYDGESYLSLNGRTYHEDCLYDNMSTRELLSALGIEPRIARSEGALRGIFVGGHYEKKQTR